MKNQFTKYPLKRMFIINISIYAFAYIIKTFIIWKITNPLQWIIDLPIYENIQRGIICLLIPPFLYTEYVILSELFRDEISNKK